MPKEYVAGIGVGGFDGVDLTPAVRVGWSRETEYVQIATLTREHENDFTASAPSWSGGYHIDLDRQGINALIRTLRRARDQAYGRDE